MYNSPLQSMVQDGEEILRNLDENARNLEMAIEHKFATGRRLAEIEATYKDLESEYLVEQLYRDQPASPVKLLAADKELIRDAELVRARTSGKLAPAWNMLNRARTEQINAQMAFEQMETRFRATRLASELRAAILLTFAKG